MSAAQNDQANSLQSHAIDLPLPFSEPPTITVQPTQGNSTNVRRPIPVATIDFETTNVSHYIPVQGLDFFRGAEQLQIEQTVELNELLLGMESENRYLVKVPHGETLFYASESSQQTFRSCFGPSRSFTMKFYDQTQQLALEFHRRLACQYPLFCYLQKLEVLQSPGEFLGSIEQQFSPSTPIFFVFDRRRDVIFRVQGSSNCGCYSSMKEEYFKILNKDGTVEIGGIVHQWDQTQFLYNLIVQFNTRSIDSQEKALLLGAAFLLEYMYFQNIKCCALRC